MKRIILIAILLFLSIFCPFIVSADELPSKPFRAEVIKVLEEKTIHREDGSQVVQQDLLLLGLDGEHRGKEIVSNGVGDVDLVSVGNFFNNSYFTSANTQDFFLVSRMRWANTIICKKI